MIDVHADSLFHYTPEKFTKNSCKVFINNPNRL